VKRYATFAYDCYYPTGGWSDFRGAFDTPEEARAHLATLGYDIKEVIDLHTGEEVK
jgi:hypothetical protein